jgi:proteasome-associated ATPase
MSDKLARIGEAGLELTTVTDISGEHAMLANGIFALNDGFDIGQNVLIYQRTGQVVEALDYTPLLGELFVIEAVKDHWVEIRVKGDRKLISKGKFISLKSGDVVLLDRNHVVVQAVIEHAKIAPVAENPITWDQIGGNEEAKQLLIEAIELPYQHPKLFAHYKQGNANGILLEGPPGCGKTLLGKAAATSIGATGGFIYIKGPEVLNEYVGASEAAIRGAFARARAFKETYGKPAVIFLEEGDSLLRTRGTSYNFMGQTIVPMFLAEMDGLDSKGAIVIISTNRADVIDPAIKREGRIDFKVEVKRPTEREAREIMAIHMRNKPVDRDHAVEKLIELTTAELYQHPLPYSGALIEGTVSKAVTHAIRRDIATNRTVGSGLTSDDFAWAIKKIVEQEGKHAA